jgi:hypothetical protein
MHDVEAWTRIAGHLDQLLDLEPEERAGWLQQLGRTQPEYARVLQALLVEADSMKAEH